MNSDRTNAPRAVVSRLTKYLAHLQFLDSEGSAWVSSQDIADALGLTSATVRHDLAHLNFSGVANRGYAVNGLCRELATFLGADSRWNAVVVGAGNLGKALALHGEFPRRGFTIGGIFDVDRRKIGTRVGDLTIQPLEELPPTISERNIDIGIIAVPGTAAQMVADLLIASGIRGILNLSLTHVIAPRRVRVVDGRLVACMLELAHGIKFSSVSADIPAAIPHDIHATGVPSC